MSSEIGELESRLDKVCSRAPGSPEHVDALNVLAWELGLAETQRSRELAEQALELARKRRYQRGVAYAIRTIGYCHLLGSELDRALESSMRALEWFRKLEERAGEASALNVIGVAYSRLGNYDKALEHALVCLKLYRELGDRRGEAWAEVEIGNVHSLVGDLGPAREHYEKGRAIFEAIDYPVGTSRVLTLLGTVEEKSGRRDLALEYFQGSLRIGETQKLALVIAGNCSEIGRLFEHQGDFTEARRNFLRAIELSEALPQMEFRASARLNLGELALKEGNAELACRLLSEALQLVRDLSTKRTNFRIHGALSRLYELTGELDKALEHYKKFHQLQQEVFDEEGQVRLRNLQVRMGVERAEKQAEIERLRFVELKELQAQLVQSEKMALLGNLIAGLSHELNTPVGVITSNASLAERALEVAIEDIESRGASRMLPAESRWQQSIDALRTSLGASNAAGRRIAELVSSLKKYARLDEAEFQRADVTEGLKDTLRLFEPQLPETVELETEIAAAPAIECYPGQLNQVFMTLLVNAAEAIEGKGKIRVEAGDDQRGIWIRISDNGRGIPSERLPNLFDINFGRKREQMRLRMGLSNALGIVQKHGGTIRVASEVGSGTSFNISLPTRVVVPMMGFGRRPQAS